MAPPQRPDAGHFAARQPERFEAPQISAAEGLERVDVALVDDERDDAAEVDFCEHAQQFGGPRNAL